MITAKMLSGLKLNGNIYWVMVLRLLLAMGLFTICRIGFYAFNVNYFPEITVNSFLRILYGGLRFDLTAVLYINIIIILPTVIPLDLRFTRRYQAVLKYIFFFFNGIALAMNVADFIYYKFTLRRTTADIFDEFGEGLDGTAIFFRFVFDYWYAVLFLLALLWLMVKLYNLTKVQGPMLKNRVSYYTFGILFIPLLAYLFVGAVRGGFRHSTRPITLSNAGEFVEHPNETNIVLNTPFSVFRTIGKNKIKKLTYFDDEQKLNALFNPVHIPNDTTTFQPENVVVIILESFSKEFMGIFNRDKENYPGYTPFLDSLVQHSKAFQYSFSSGRKSIDAPPSVLAGIPTFSVPFVLTPFANNDFKSLASILGKEGYHSSFFSGQPNGAMGFTSFSRLAGFEHYYGMDEYGNNDDFDGIWGIWDHKFLPYYADMLNSFPQPFVSTIFTVSSHHPFVVPKEFEGRFKGGKQPILKCIEYTDYALREFFKRIAGEPWYPNTLFVFTADHCSSDIIFDESRTTSGLFSIPIFFFKPDNSLAGMEQQITQQVDIMPSVLGYLHYNKPYFAFGRDVFRENTTSLAFNYRDSYNLFMDKYLINFDGQQTIGLYNYRADRMVTENLKDKMPEVASRMEEKMKAIIQQYNNRMVDNELTVK
ncbi:MAG: LTA synthase family protein [Cyclobacteriaceae bacterium]|nr:LTA synthase family protein [Cyclobacteriaceae bacterium]MDH4295927.1 LTA synthase family protein [Cyclobacteriaceae bacterium]MDH5249447.1 LTA synthase family protein [Cyclobacteriaceae bacterium]